MIVYSPPPGTAWNPMRKEPNLPCYCGSKKKAKKCHGKIDLVPLDQVEQIESHTRSFGRKPTGRTPDNARRFP